MNVITIGHGNHKLNYSAAGHEPALLIMPANPPGEVGASCGDTPGTEVSSDECNAMICFSNEAGFRAFLANLEDLRRTHFPEVTPIQA